MFCMKCGREVHDDQSFCPDCVAVMEKYPIKPGTVVLLPKRREGGFAPRPAPRRKTVTAEEQNRKLRKSLRVMFITWVVTFLLLCATGYLSVVHILEDRNFVLGQNYSVITNEDKPES